MSAWPKSGLLGSGQPLVLPLKLRNHHYHFRVSYTENRADLVTFGKSITITHESAHATVTGTVQTAKLIAGTVSVAAKGCNLKTSKHQATRFKPA